MLTEINGRGIGAAKALRFFSKRFLKTSFNKRPKTKRIQKSSFENIFSKKLKNKHVLKKSFF